MNWDDVTTAEPPATGGLSWDDVSSADSPWSTQQAVLEPPTTPLAQQPEAQQPESPQRTPYEPQLRDWEKWEQTQVQQLATGVPYDLEDSQAKWDAFYATLPDGRETELRGRKLTEEQNRLLVDAQTAERHNETRKRSLDQRRAEMQALGMDPQSYRMKERYERDQRNFDDRLFNLPMFRGAAKGAETLVSAPAENVLRLFGQDDTANTLARDRQDDAAYAAYADQQQGKVASFVQQGADMLAKYTPAGLAGMPGILAAVGSESQATKMHEGLQDGMSKGQATAYGAVHAAKDMILTWLGGKVAGKLGGRTFEQAMSGGGAGGLSNETFGAFAKRFVTGWGIEAFVEEIPQYAGELAIDKYARTDYKPKTWQEVQRDVVDIIAITGVMQLATAPMESGGPRAAQDFIENKSRRSAEAAGLSDIVKTKADRERVAKQAKVLWTEVRTNGDPGAYSGEQKQLAGGQKLLPGPTEQTSQTEHEGLKQAPSSQAAGIVPPGPTISVSLQDGFEATAKTFKKYFTSGAGRPGEVNEALDQEASFVRKSARRLHDVMRGMEKQARKAYGVKSLAKVPDYIGEQLQEALNDPKSPLWKQMPPDLAAAVQKVRSHIDELSSRIASMPEIGDELTLTIEGNLGEYTTRTYRKFDDPKWSKKALADPDIMSAFAEDVRAESPDATDDDVRKLAEVLLNSKTLSVSGEGATARTNKFVNVLKSRKDLTPGVRKLYGENKNAFENYQRTVQSLSRLIGQTESLRSMKAAGLQSGLLAQDLQSAPSNANLVRFDAQQHGVRQLRPLDGLYMPREVAESLIDAYKAVVPNAWYQAAVTASGLAKASKTVYSWQSSMRNFKGNVPMMIANGVFDVRELAKAAKAVQWTDVAGIGRTDAHDAYMQKMAELGLLEDVSMSELRSIARDISTNMESYLMGTDPVSTGKLAMRKAAAFYQGMDTIFKIAHFETLRPQYAEAMSGATSAEIDQHVARIIRDLLPTYSNASKAARAISRFPALGPFAMFSFEILRTSANRARVTAEELRSGNPALQKLGAKKLAGQTLAYGGLAAMAKASMMLFGIGDDEDDALHRLAPPWQQNTQWIHNGPIENGVAKFSDTGYENPFGVWMDTIKAAAGGDYQGAVREFYEPLIGEDLAGGAIVSVWRNQDDGGRQVYDPGLDSVGQLKQIVDFVWNRFEPGTMTSGRRVLKGWRGDVVSRGKKYDFWRELISATTGTRLDEMDINVAASWKHQQAAREYADSERAITRAFGSGATQSPDDLRSIYESADNKRRETFARWTQSMRDLDTLGVQDPMSSARNSLASNDTIKRVYAGQYQPYLPSKSTLNRWRRENEFGEQRVQLILQLYQEALQKE